MVQLQPIELLSGILAIIVVFFSTLVGILIISRYFKHKQKSFLFIGLTWIGLVQIWWGISISTIYVLTTGSLLSDPMYMVMGNIFIPLTAIIAVLGFTELFAKSYQKKLVIPYIIYGVIFEIVFLYYIFTDYRVLGKVNSPVDATYYLFVIIFQIFCLITLIIISTIFTRISLRSDNPEIKLRGKLVLLGAYLFLIGAIFEIISDISIVILILGRLFLICSSFTFYSGLILPNWLEKMLKK